MVRFKINKSKKKHGLEKTMVVFFPVIVDLIDLSWHTALRLTSAK